MKHFCKVLIAFCLFGYGTSIQAQTSIPAAGGNASGTGGTISYTIGQVAYKPISGTSNLIIQGVQLPYEISVLTTIEKASGIGLELSVYPNPANSYVTLKVENYDKGNLAFRLYDMNGALLQVRRIEGNETLIHLGNILPGAYILKIADNDKEVKTFKIIKK